jgi:hypothetical protein
VLGWLACLVGLVRQLSSPASSSAARCDTVAAHVLEATLQASVMAAIAASSERFLVNCTPFAYAQHQCAQNCVLCAHKPCSNMRHSACTGNAALPATSTIPCAVVQRHPH